MKLYSYVVRCDQGFAPNPFWDYCTLACCKPAIRRLARVGDWITGTGSVKNVGQNRLIYAMKVTEKRTFQEYFSDARFKNKIPSEGLVEERGDNIYFMDQNNIVRQRCPSYHSRKNKDHDLGGEYVLISNNFVYFGKSAIEIPSQFNAILKKGPGHKSQFDKQFVRNFVDWVESLRVIGKIGDPCIFKQKLCFRTTS